MRGGNGPQNDVDGAPYLVATEVNHVGLEKPRRRLARLGGHAAGALVEHSLDEGERRVVGHVERLQARGARADLTKVRRCAGGAAGSHGRSDRKTRSAGRSWYQASRTTRPAHGPGRARRRQTGRRTWPANADMS